MSRLDAHYLSNADLLKIAKKSAENLRLVLTEIVKKTKTKDLGQTPAFHFESLDNVEFFIEQKLK